MSGTTISEPSKKKSLKWWLLLVLFWFPLGLAGINLTLNASGVCISQARYWSDDELIEVAVRALAQARYVDESKRIWKEMAIDDSEVAVQKFLKDNPRCCSLTRHGEFTWDTVQVELNYARHPVRPESRRDPYYTQYVAVSTCGEFVTSGRGISSNTLETTLYNRHSK